MFAMDPSFVDTLSDLTLSQLSDMTKIPLTSLLALLVLVVMLSFAGARAGKPAFAFLRRTMTMSSDRTLSPKGMPVLPPNVVKYSQVPRTGLFTTEKIPKGLLKEHTTKKGTWGVIRVSTGKLSYQINAPCVREYELSPDVPPGIIEPTVLHQVKALTSDLEFVVEFHRLPNTGPVDEKRE